MNRRIVFVVAIAAAVVGGLVAAPRRYQVDGVSMGPGLLPGDIVATGWLPLADGWRAPRRFDRWIVTLPDGTTGLKRVVGLAGEEVAFVGGDLAIDGGAVLKGPRLLATLGSVVEMPPPQPAGGSAWSLPPATLLDDAPFATGEVSRLLLPVCDAGFAAEIVVPVGVDTAGVRASAGPLAVTWRLTGPGRYAVVAGRLDGHAVAAAWPLPAGPRVGQATRSCLPPLPPAAWDVVRPWPAATSTQGEDPTGARSPCLAVELVAAGNPAAVIEGVAVWRDILFRPAATGVHEWKLGPAELLLLGDFPSASRDSRHFGPLSVSALRHRLQDP